MHNTVFLHDGDYHQKSPILFDQCMNASVVDMLARFHSSKGARSTGSFLLEDFLYEHLEADLVKPYDLQTLEETKPSVIITTDLEQLDPKFVFNKAYWQRLLNLGATIVPMPLGIVWHEDWDNDLTKDMADILCQMAERSELGVSGEYTAELLNRHGIKNVRIIGNPALYSSGSRDFAVCRSACAPKNINTNFNTYFRDFHEIPNRFWAECSGILHYFIRLYREGAVHVDYTLERSFFRELTLLIEIGGIFETTREFVLNTGRYFFSAQDWISALKNNDFSLGTCFYGNVASVLAGTPALFIAPDRRTEELVKTHQLPFIRTKDMNLNKSIDFFYDLCDYTAFNRHYAAAYDQFLDYCRKNGVILK